MSNLRVEYPLGTLSKDDAKARLTALGEYLQNKHGIRCAWNAAGDAASINGKYMVVSIEGTLTFAGTTAVFEGKDPGFLWRGKAKEYLANKLSVYLDPKTSADSLPRK
jgi:hypothetical protein